MARRDTNSLNSVTDSSRPSRRASTFRGRNSGFRSRSRPVLWDVRWTFWQRFAPLREQRGKETANEDDLGYGDCTTADLNVNDSPKYLH